MGDDSDPTKDPKFKKVVDHFLKTPPKPHKRKRDDEASQKERDGSRPAAKRKED
jgi:hypothetical protein